MGSDDDGITGTFFREALEAANAVVLGLDAHGTVIFLNRRGSAISGYEADEMRGQDPFVRLFPDRSDEVRARLLKASVDRAPVSFEAEITTRTGERRLTLWHAAPCGGGAANGPPSVVAIGNDVTEQRELERVARRSERLAATGALAAGLAHEIRNPLNGATLHLEGLDRALSRARNVPEDAREAVAVLRSEMRRLSALVTDFLEVARPKAPVRADCDLNQLVIEVASFLRPEAESHAIRLTVELSSEGMGAQLDAERLRQVLVNLVRNAIEADSQAGVGNRIVIRTRRAGPVVELEVEDDGPGLPDADAPIFDAFYTTKPRGTGLGLSIVSRIVEDHGGSVVVASKPGKTTFTVHLPVSEVRPS